MPPSLPDALQQLLGPRFRLERELAGGGMSRVFVAHEPALKRDVVVKVLPTDLFTSRSAARFQQEIEVTAHLQHPHILPVVTAGGSDAIRYLVVPYIPGGSLRDQLASGARWSLDAGLSLVDDLLAAVAFAHERGIVHRDIKPGNVLLAEGHAVLADFGIAQAFAGASADDAAMSTSIAPPAAYLAPERPTDAAADLFAVAVVSHELLAGGLPTAGPSVDALVRLLREAHAAEDRRRLEAVATVLARALSTDAHRRYLTAQTLRTALQQAGRVRPPRRRSAALVGGAIAASLLLLLAARQSSPPSPDPRSTPSRETIPDAPAATALDVTPPDPSPVRPAIDVAERRTPALAPDELAARRWRATIDSVWPWMAADRERAAQAALEALAFRAALAPHEALVADGIVALARREFTAACAAFDASRTERETYAAWMGSGECRARDSVVVLDAAGQPTFRSSYFDAARAYREAGRMAGPATRTLAYTRMTHVLFIDPARVRRGIMADGRVMLGQPVALGDSIAFETFAPGPRRRTPASVSASARALTMARELLRPALVSWRTAEPTAVRPGELLADLLESTGNVRDAAPDGLTALAVLQTARTLPADRETALRLARSHVRLLLRTGDFAAAARLADSVVAGTPRLTDAEAELVLPLAMLTGQASRATALLEQVSGGPGRQLQLGEGRVLDVPASAFRARAEFQVSATLGLCNEAVRSGPARLAAIVDAMFPTGERPRGAEGAFMERPMLLALPCLDLAGVRALRDPSHPIARALHQPGDQAVDRATALFDAMRRGRQQPGAGGFDATESALTEAHVHLMRADTAAASAALARALDGVAVMPNVFLHAEILAGTLPRAMALHAELAAARGDSRTARYWGAGAAALWRNADPSLQPLVQRLARLGAAVAAPAPL